MMKAAELEIKMNFHAGMPLVYNYKNDKKLKNLKGK